MYDLSILKRENKISDKGIFKSIKLLNDNYMEFGEIWGNRFVRLLHVSKNHYIQCVSITDASKISEYVKDNNLFMEARRWLSR